MLRILHLVEDTTANELRWLLGCLLERAPRRRCEQFVVMSRSGVNWPAGGTGRFFMGRGIEFFSAATLKRIIFDRRVDVVHSWSLSTATAAIHATGGDVAVALSVWDPYLPQACGSRVRILNRHANIGVLCSEQMVYRRLIEHGIRAPRCVVLRPAVDFARINKARRSADLRGGLGLAEDDWVALLPELPARRCGALHGLWAVDVANRLHPQFKLLLPARRAQFGPLLRYVRRMYRQFILCIPSDEQDFEDLLAVTDTLIVPAIEDVPAMSIAWSMASAVPVLGNATYCVAEFIADRHNGMLVKPGAFIDMAGKLIELRNNDQLRSRICDTARGQAFESFGIARYVEQTLHAYENLAQNKPVATDMVDAALDT